MYTIKAYTNIYICFAHNPDEVKRKLFHLKDYRLTHLTGFDPNLILR